MACRDFLPKECLPAEFTIALHYNKEEWRITSKAAIKPRSRRKQKIRRDYMSNIT